MFLTGSGTGWGKMKTESLCGTEWSNGKTCNREISSLATPRPVIFLQQDPISKQLLTPGSSQGTESRKRPGVGLDGE